MFKSDPIIPCGGVLHSHIVPYTTPTCFIVDWTFILINFTCLHFNKEIGEKILIGVVFIRHLNGTVLASFVWPAVLITDAYNALKNQPYRRGEKENEFGGTIFL